MQQEFRKKLLPIELNWLVLNNLKQFNDKPNLIKELLEKVTELSDHALIGMFVDYYGTVYNDYFLKHNSFPDMAWLDANFKKTKAIKITDDSFSMSIYEDLNKFLDQEILRQKLEKYITSKESPSPDDFRVLSQEMAKFSDSMVLQEDITKNKLLTLYDDYKKDFKGIKTHIDVVDNTIGVLGFKSLSVFAAPSSHGKSTFAISVAYNTATIGGLVVDYLSFEVPLEHMWFNLYSIESSILGENIRSSDMKEAILSETDTEKLDRSMSSLFGKLNKSGGFINVIDQTTANISTFEGLCARLESIAEERGRKADLIIIDNVDNLQILKGGERDESVRVNNYIIALDAFSKKYCNGAGVAILLLSQVNRPAMKKLQDSESKDEKRSKVDVTCIQKFNALYEKGTCVLIGFADEKMRSIGRMSITPVKLRNRPIPLEPLQVPAKFAYSRIGGEMKLADTSIEQVEEIIDNGNLEEMLADILGDD